MSKLWFQSKTILFNLAAIVAVAVQVGVFGTLIPLEYEVTAFAIANLALRYVTSQGVTAPSKSDVKEAADVIKKVVLRK